MSTFAPAAIHCPGLPGLWASCPVTSGAPGIPEGIGVTIAVCLVVTLMALGTLLTLGLRD